MHVSCVRCIGQPFEIDAVFDTSHRMNDFFLSYSSSLVIDDDAMFLIVPWKLESV